MGDLLIWETILEIGQKSKRDMIFVSGEEKADWQHRADNTALLPRFELLDEYRRASNGRALYIVPLSKLLELLNVAEDSVNEVKNEEVRVLEASLVDVECPYCSLEFSVHVAPAVGSSMVPICPKCDQRFHVHRTRSGVTVHAGSPSFARSGKRETVVLNPSETLLQNAVAVDCPSCGELTMAILGSEPGSKSWARCTMCATNFAISRGADLEVIVGETR